MVVRKGISPLIAAVLLIAFTMAVAGMFSQWAPSLTEDAMGDTSDQAAQISSCAQSMVDVRQSVQRGDNEISTTFGVQSDQELDDFTLTFVSDNSENIVQKHLDNQNLSNGDIRTVGIETPDTGLRYSRVEVASEGCPSSDTSDIALDCPSGFTGFNELGGFCIMNYEASHEDATGSSTGSSSVAASQQGVVPWTNIDYPTARSACQEMGEGYNLSTNKQWQAATGAVIGQPSTFVHGNNDNGQAWEDSSETCTIDPTSDSDRCLTGTGADTWETSKGVTDLNGNVWEWVYVTSGDAQGNVDQSHPMHFSDTDNYVNAWNNTGEYPTSLGSANESFGYDHYWSSAVDDRAVLRGGDQDNGRDAGPFSMTLSYSTSTTDADFGFRCSY